MTARPSHFLSSAAAEDAVGELAAGVDKVSPFFRVPRNKRELGVSFNVWQLDSSPLTFPILRNVTRLSLHRAQRRSALLVLALIRLRHGDGIHQLVEELG